MGELKAKEILLGLGITIFMLFVFIVLFKTVPERTEP